MSSWDILTMCLRNLFKRKLRTSLTILGVMIGTTSIVVMISLGLALNEKFEQEIKNMGDVTVITVRDYNYYNNARMGVVSVSIVGDSSAGQQPQTNVLDDNMIQAFENMPGVVVATPIAQVNLYFKSGKYVMDNWNVMGIKPEAMALMGYKATDGRLLQTGDKYEMVFGAYTEKNFAEPENYWRNNRFYDAMSGNETSTLVDIFQDRITMSFDSNYIWGFQNSDQEYDIDDENAPKPIKPIDVTAVGLLEYRNDWNIDRGIFMDIDVVKKLQSDAQKAQQANQQEWGMHSAIQGGQNTGYETAYVKCKDLETTKTVHKQIQEMGFDAWIPTQYLDFLQEQAKSNQMLLAVIGAVSLFVAAIGIANTMIMAIYERTREIGVMKVIGAAIRDIQRMFLLESALIGFFGGLFGVGLSYLVSYLLNNWQISFFGNMFGYLSEQGTGSVSLITPWLCGVALLFAAAIGLASGYFPARRAMRLSALSAIRTE